MARLKHKLLKSSHSSPKFNSKHLANRQPVLKFDLHLCVNRETVCEYGSVSFICQNDIPCSTHKAFPASIEQGVNNYLILKSKGPLRMSTNSGNTRVGFFDGSYNY